MGELGAPAEQQSRQRLDDVVLDEFEAALALELPLFSARPVRKLSTHTTRAPSAINRSHRLEPMKPAPPVTSAILSCCRFKACSLFLWVLAGAD